jgi:CubicO group peptidase (beta-lactamase class C family)
MLIDKKIRQSLWRPSAIVLVCSLCGLLSGCGTLSHRERDTDNVQARQYANASNLQQEVDSLALPIIEQHETPGMVVGVLLPNGSMKFFGYGVANQNTTSKPDADTLFAIGSLSKGFLGDLTAVLVDEGTLSWSDTLGELLPADAPLSADARKITVLQLATHTSGLPLQPMTFQTFRYVLEYMFTGENLYRHLDSNYVFNYLSDFKAPTQVTARYSNFGYGILGYVIQRRTGQSLDTLLEQKLLRPLGLNNTGYVPDTLPNHKDRASGHVGDQPKFKLRGAPMPDWQFPDLMKGSAGVYSNAKDLLTLAAAHMHRDQSHLNHILADTLQVRFPRPVDAHAIAWFADDIEGQHITYQVGMVSGFSSYLGLDVQKGTAVVVLQNSFNWTDHVGQKLLLRMARAPVVEPQPLHAIPEATPQKTALLKSESKAVLLH